MNITSTQLEKTLLKPFTKEEEKNIEDINREIKNLEMLYRQLRSNNHNQIDFKSKYSGDNNGQYGYFMSCFSGPLYVIMKRLNFTKLLDLGSGPGLIFNPIKSKLPKQVACRFEGYEIEDELISIGKNLGNNIIKKDILKITKKDIEDFEVIYFYEPFWDKKLASKFVRNLSKIVTTGQVICYNFADWHIGNYMTKNPKFQKLDRSLSRQYWVTIFKVV